MFADLVHTGRVCREMRFRHRYEIMPPLQVGCSKLIVKCWGKGMFILFPCLGDGNALKGQKPPAQGRMERSGMAPWVSRTTHKNNALQGQKQDYQ